MVDFLDPGISESNGPISTKISGLVDGWKGFLTWYIILRSLKRRCHGKQLNLKNQRFPRNSLLCRSVIRKRIAISQFRFQKIKWHEFLYIVYNFSEI